MAWHDPNGGRPGCPLGAIRGTGNWTRLEPKPQPALHLRSGFPAWPLLSRSFRRQQNTHTHMSLTDAHRLMDGPSGFRRDPTPVRDGDLTGRVMVVDIHIVNATAASRRAERGAVCDAGSHCCCPFSDRSPLWPVGRSCAHLPRTHTDKWDGGDYMTVDLDPRRPDRGGRDLPMWQQAHPHGLSNSKHVAAVSLALSG